MYKKSIKFILVLLLSISGFVAATAQTTVTFNLDMRRALQDAFESFTLYVFALFEEFSFLSAILTPLNFFSI